MRSKRCSTPASIAETVPWHRRPESAVRAYLTAIDRNPESVEKALHEQVVTRERNSSLDGRGLMTY